MKSRSIICGAEGLHFLLQYQTGVNKHPHMNLFGLRKGKLVMFNMDHVIPRSKGGKSVLSNLKTCCIICNQRKGNKMPKPKLTKNSLMNLYLHNFLSFGITF